MEQLQGLRTLGVLNPRGVIGSMARCSPVIGLTLNYRDPARTRQCVWSLVKDGAHEVWIWDNSEDLGRSASILKNAFCGEKRIIVHESPINYGFAAGVNRALYEIQTKNPAAYVLIINNDAVILPGGIQALKHALKTHPKARIAYSEVRQNSDIIHKRYYHRWTGAITTSKLPGSFEYPNGCAFLLSLNRISLPFFDEDFFMYGEDTMLGWKLKPEEIVYVGSTWVRHEGSASSQMGSLFYEARVVAGHWILGRKLSASTWDFLAAFIGRFLYLSCRAAIRALRNQSWVPVKAFIDGWRLAFIHDPMRLRVKHYDLAISFNRDSHWGTIRSGQ